MLGWGSYICSHLVGVRPCHYNIGQINVYTCAIESFGNAQLWRDALVQNAWDTGLVLYEVEYVSHDLSHDLLVSPLGAGGGSLLTYASYLTRRQGSVKLGFTIPFVNNFVR